MVSSESIDEMVDLRTEAIQEADRSCIPRRRRQFRIFGLTPEVMALIGERRAAIRRWQSTRDPVHRQHIRVLSSCVDKTIASLVNRRFGSTVGRISAEPGTHHRKFWKLVRNLRRKPLAVPTIRTVDEPLVTSAEKCQAFASHYRDISGSA